MRHCRNLKTTYQHTQFGTVIIAATAGGCLLLTALVPLTAGAVNAEIGGVLQ
jgi:hypothetical protein